MQDTYSSSVTPIDLRHERCLAILPWWVNGTLAGAELALVESHLRGCSACQREAAQLKVLAAHVRAQEAAAIKPRRVDVVTVKAGDTVQSLAKRMAYTDYQLDRFLTINALEENSALRAGQRVKIVTW